MFVLHRSTSQSTNTTTTTPADSAGYNHGGAPAGLGVSAATGAGGVTDAGIGGGVTLPDVIGCGDNAKAAFNSKANCNAVCWRSFGFNCKARCTMASSSGGTPCPGAASSNDRARADTRNAASCRSLFATIGNAPVSAS